MTVKRVIAIAMSAAFFAVPVFAQDDAVDEAVAVEAEDAAVEVAEETAAAAQPARRNRVLEIEEFNAKLDSVFAILTGEGVAAASPIYGQAKGRLREAGYVISRKPASKEAGLLFSVCSVSAAGALMQLEREVNLSKARQLSAERDSLLFVLHNLHEEINRIEGNRANRLSQDLEATRARTAMIEGDLEATRGNLEATQAMAEAERARALAAQQQARAAQRQAQAAQQQAALLQEDLEAERERARQVMEDAQRRFNELESEMIKVSRDARGTIITMADILFESGKATLTENLKINLATIAGILIGYKEPKLLVEGHTDNQGSREFNQKLSEDRASGVMNFLIERGVEAERLTSVGSAFDKPIADNSTAEGRARNRRVDLIIQDAEHSRGLGEKSE